MTCQRTDLGPVTVWTCGRDRRKPEDAPLCEVCKVHPAVKECTFALRGAKAGKRCERKLCRKCAGDSGMCPPHRALVVKEILATRETADPTD